MVRIVLSFMVAFIVVVFCGIVLILIMYEPQTPIEEQGNLQVAGALCLLVGVFVYSIACDTLYKGPPPLFPAGLDDPIIERLPEKAEEEQDFEIKPFAYQEPPSHRALPHVLLHGGAGQGKSALSFVTSKELELKYGHNIEVIKCTPSQLQKKRELDEVMLRVAQNPFCVLFIDEIHGLPLVIEESLYAALQDFEYDITLSKEIDLGNGYNFSINEESGVQTIQLPKFTCIGATTLLGKINKPLKDRFPIKIEMHDYSHDELKQIIEVFNKHEKPHNFETYIGQVKAKRILQMHIDAVLHEGGITIAEDSKDTIAKTSMNTSRLVIQRTKNCMALARSKGLNVVTPDLVEEMMDMYGIDENGLDRAHRAIINHLLKQNNKPIGSQALAEAVGVTKDDIDSIYVGELTKAGLLTRDGRSMKQLTEEALRIYERS